MEPGSTRGSGTKDSRPGSDLQEPTVTTPTVAMLAEPERVTGALFFPIVRVLVVPSLAGGGL